MRTTTVILAIVAGAITAHAGQQPALDDVLRRLDRYLEEYEALLATLVAEERYSQEVRLRGSVEPRTRVLLSDYAPARAAGGHAWTGFRDTHTVDGVPLRGREDRLSALLADGSESSARQALRITRENARHNLGEDIVARTINVPTVALDFLHPQHRARFAFSRRGGEVVDGVAAWVVAFAERRGPTLLRTPDGRDRRARGLAWVDPDTGEVLRTDLAWEGEPGGRIVVHYRREPGLDALVPATMLEEYRAMTGTVTGRATYTNYRRFQTAARLVEPASQ